MKNIDIEIAILENIDIDIDRDILENININKDILGNININRRILENISINKIWYWDLGYRTPLIADLFSKDLFDSFQVTVEEVASEGYLWTPLPLGAIVLLRLHDDEHLKGVFEVDLVH